jgi:hypothetical protein
VLDDDVVDSLIGGDGMDWFFASTSGTRRDLVMRRQSRELIGT